MVTPIHIITVGLGSAFFLGLFSRMNINLKGALMMLALLFMTFISAQWGYAYLTERVVDPHIFTAGHRPPVSINLYMHRAEALITLMINLLGVMSGIFLWDRLKATGKSTMAILIILFMSLNVIVLTRDLFNLFVFMEVSGIAIAGLILLDRKAGAVSAGFKYMMATGLIAGLFLLGVIFAYYYTGSLNLDDVIANNINSVKGGIVAGFLIIMAVLLELKPFPANGWALDVYEHINPGISAIFSAGSATAMYYVIIKVMPIAPQHWLGPVAIAGIITFLLSNLIALNQNNTRRMLGYSSIAQIGLLLFIMGGMGNSPRVSFVIITILGTHYFAKAALFWLSGVVNRSHNNAWSALRKSPLLIFFAGLFIMALIGLPPFPSFFGKWELIMTLSQQDKTLWIVLVLAGSLLEAFYLLRWFGHLVRGDNEDYLPNKEVSIRKMIPVALFGILLLTVSFLTMQYIGITVSWIVLPLALVLLLFFIDFASAKIKNLLLIVAMGYYLYDYAFYTLIPSDDILRLVFSGIFLAGGLAFLIPGFAYQGKRPGMYPMLALMFSGLAIILRAQTLLEFFVGWEFMTIGSYMLVLRGRSSRKAAFSFIMFSLLGAYAMLAGFGFSFADSGLLTLDAFSQASGLAVTLIVIAFMIKIASIGLHIWLPGAYAEADDDVTPIISAILIKSGVFGIILLFIHGATTLFNGIDIAYLLGWIGALTAILGNIMAVFQEDVKKLLAYSSIGVLGYILFSFAMMSHMGWLAGVTYSAVHFLYKGLLFIAIAGVIYRTKTRKIYEMGGLIKKMPLSFIAVLIGIITLAGMPPLAGFAGKWMLYNAVILKGWYFQGAIVFFAGIVAFLYCFKLIHNIFLGPIKDHLRQVREAPVWIILPQLILILGIMFLSVQPRYFLEPVGHWLASTIQGEGLVWEGTTASTSLGYWDPTAIMIIVGGMFAVLLGSLLLLSRKAQKVKMFNIVFQAEQPDRPETTHVAFNMFAHYNKALGFLTMPLASRFWKGVTNNTMALGWQIKRIYNGNGQAYVLHMLIFIVLFYLLSMGGY